MSIRARKAGLIAGLALGVAAAALAATFAPASVTDAAAGGRANRQAFHDQMRTLWAGDHIVWTRCFIVSVATLPYPATLPDTEATTARLVLNQSAIGEAFKPFYGDAAADELTELLTAHILGAAALIDAARSGGDVTAASEAWYANAEEIAAFLHELNPENWPLEAVEGLLEDHLDLTLEEAGARIGGNYAGDVVAYDAVHAQVLVLADALSNGIIAQFPEKFAR